MSQKVYYINRYDFHKEKTVKNHSGYEQLVKYLPNFYTIEPNRILTKLIFELLKVKKPKDYRSHIGSLEIILGLKALIYKRPIFYLYADKDAYLLPLLKRKFKWKRLQLFGTLHWPKESSSEYSFYKYSLRDQFDGIVALSSSLSVADKVIPHGIDLDFWQNSQIGKYSNYYLLLGISNRDHQGQVAIIKEISAIDPTARFILLMTDQEVGKLYQAISNLAIVKEKLSDIELKTLYSQCKAVILIQNYCLASNVVLESMAMGVPLIANRVGDIEEYLGSEYLLFVELGQEQEVLRKICFNSNFRVEIVNQLLERRKKFAWPAIALETKIFIQSKR